MRIILGPRAAPYQGRLGELGPLYAVRPQQMLGSTNRSEAEMFVELAGDEIVSADLKPYPPRVLFLRRLNGLLHQGSPDSVSAPVGVNDDIADHVASMIARSGAT